MHIEIKVRLLSAVQHNNDNSQDIILSLSQAAVMLTMVAAHNPKGG